MKLKKIMKVFFAFSAISLVPASTYLIAQQLSSTNKSKNLPQAQFMSAESSHDFFKKGPGLLVPKGDEYLNFTSSADTGQQGFNGQKAIFPRKIGISKKINTTINNTAPKQTYGMSIDENGINISDNQIKVKYFTYNDDYTKSALIKTLSQVKNVPISAHTAIAVEVEFPNSYDVYYEDSDSTTDQFKLATGDKSLWIKKTSTGSDGNFKTHLLVHKNTKNETSLMWDSTLPSLPGETAITSTESDKTLAQQFAKENPGFSLSSYVNLMGSGSEQLKAKKMAKITVSTNLLLKKQSFTVYVRVSDDNKGITFTVEPSIVAEPSKLSDEFMVQSPKTTVSKVFTKNNSSVSGDINVPIDVNVKPGGEQDIITPPPPPPQPEFDPTPDEMFPPFGSGEPEVLYKFGSGGDIASIVLGSGIGATAIGGGAFALLRKRR